MRPVEIHNVQNDKHYVCAHQWGDSYSGPGGGKIWERGLLNEPHPIPGGLLRQNALAICSVFFEYREDCKLSWNGNEWQYVTVVPEKPPKPVKEEPKAPAPEERERLRCGAVTASGNPCKRWRLNGQEACAHHVD